MPPTETTTRRQPVALHIDGARRRTDNAARARWYALQRAIRYARYFRSLAQGA